MEDRRRALDLLTELEIRLPICLDQRLHGWGATDEATELIAEFIDHGCQVAGRIVGDAGW